MNRNPMHLPGEDVTVKNNRPNKRHEISEALEQINHLDIKTEAGLTGPYPHLEIDVMDVFPNAEIHCCEIDTNTFSQLERHVKEIGFKPKGLHNCDFKEVLEKEKPELVITDLCGHITSKGTSNHMDLVEASFKDSPKAVILTGSVMGLSKVNRKYLDNRHGLIESNYPDHRRFMNSVATVLANTGDSKYKLVRSKRYRDTVLNNRGAVMNIFTLIRTDLI